MPIPIVFLIVRSPLTDDSHWHDVQALSRGWRKSNPFHGVRIVYVVIIVIIPAIGAQNQVIVRAYHNWLFFQPMETLESLQHKS